MESIDYRLKYTNELFTKSEHIKSGSVILTDAPVDNNGRGSVFSPTDLLSSSLVSCMMTILALDFQRKSKILKPFSAEVQKVMISDPRRVGAIKINFDFGENMWGRKELEIIERIILTCPVAKSLSSEIKIITNLKELQGLTE